jgi:hypothetical protein
MTCAGGIVGGVALSMDHALPKSEQQAPGMGEALLLSRRGDWHVNIPLYRTTAGNMIA